MENRGDADPGAEMFGIGGDGKHGFGAGLEQQIVDHPFVLIGDVGDQAWQRKDQMEVTDRQKLGLASGEPISCGRPLALWAVPVATTVEGDHRMVAVLTSRDMATECCGPATLDRTHHLELAKADMAGVSVTPCSPVVAENIRDLQLWTGHRCGGLRRL
jgi:hypothetical protein